MGRSDENVFVIYMREEWETEQNFIPADTGTPSGRQLTMFAICCLFYTKNSGKSVVFSFPTHSIVPHHCTFRYAVSLLRMPNSPLPTVNSDL